MAQTLTVIRIDEHWAVRDVTGSIYGMTTEISEAKDTADALARRIGGHVTLSDEAKAAWEARPTEPEVDAPGRKRPFATLLSRFRRAPKR